MNILEKYCTGPGRFEVDPEKYALVRINGTFRYDTSQEKYFPDEDLWASPYIGRIFVGRLPIEKGRMYMPCDRFVRERGYDPYGGQIILIVKGNAYQFADVLPVSHTLERPLNWDDYLEEIHQE